MGGAKKGDVGSWMWHNFLLASKKPGVDSSHCYLQIRVFQLFYWPMTSGGRGRCLLGLVLLEGSSNCFGNRLPVHSRILNVLQNIVGPFFQQKKLFLWENQIEYFCIFNTSKMQKDFVVCFFSLMPQYDKDMQKLWFHVSKLLCCVVLLLCSCQVFKSQSAFWIVDLINNMSENFRPKSELY